MKIINTKQCEELKYLPQGIPTVELYNLLQKYPPFISIESFSNNFLKSNEHLLFEHGAKWHPDPLHSWSRQWEYPFVYDCIVNYLNQVEKFNIKILDAGSGVTFFPYYVGTISDQININCCDMDDLKSTFSKINDKSDMDIDFHLADIHNLPFEDNSFDIVYCISVLEHTEDIEKILVEFKRILKTKGMLIVTFDISINGSADISIKDAAKLVHSLEEEFCTFDDFNCETNLKALTNSIDGFLTTEYIKTIDESLLPWAQSRSILRKVLNSLRKSNLNMTFFCSAFIND